MTLPVRRRALIVGASSGIGEATALAFAKAGIHTALTSRSQEKLEAVAVAARQFGVTAQAYPCDLSQVSLVRERMHAIAEDFGAIDILINSAGIGYTGSLMDTPLTDWQQVMDINLTSVFQCIQGILPSMRTTGKGTIVNVVSVAGQQAFPNWGAYCVSKFGLLALSKSLAAEERGNGIRVVALCPGAVNTPLWDSETVHADFNRDSMLTPAIVADAILHTVLMPAQAVVEELTLMPSAGVL